MCKLPPAWGYQHAGLERYITSFPVTNEAGSRTRVLREETDGECIALWKAREDARAYLYGILKLGAGIRVGLCHVEGLMCHACVRLHAPGKFRLTVRFHEAALHPCRHATMKLSRICRKHTFCESRACNVSFPIRSSQMMESVFDWEDC